MVFAILFRCARIISISELGSPPFNAGGKTLAVIGVTTMANQEVKHTIIFSIVNGNPGIGVDSTID
jgi:hypothetical protein